MPTSAATALPVVTLGGQERRADQARPLHRPWRRRPLSPRQARCHAVGADTVMINDDTVLQLG